MMRFGMMWSQIISAMGEAGEFGVGSIGLVISVDILD